MTQEDIKLKIEDIDEKIFNKSQLRDKYDTYQQGIKIK